ncbi:noi, partial [Symbiodinium sp. KB8]
AEAEGHAGGAEARAMAQAALLDDSDSEEEAPIYNPKKVPLDWDGKPIPYWLYKLHGLRFAFPCEVCGGTTYHGPKVFQQHFSQRTHAEGMRRLGIPNSAHFHGLSKIADVQALWARVQAEMKETEWNAAADEEFEDSVGNVMNRKTYEDLARQGLL